MFALPQAMSVQIPEFKGRAPTMFKLEGNVLPLYTFNQIALDKKKAIHCASCMRDSLAGAADNLPPLPRGGEIEPVISWLLNAQCWVCSFAGCNLTPQDFGAPDGFI